jgi:hypothetical protein
MGDYQSLVKLLEEANSDIGRWVADVKASALARMCPVVLG